MKIIKVIGLVLLIIIIIAFILSFIAPTKMESQRSITINASKELVWQNICSLEKQNEWGPWREQDPNMKVVYSGTDCSIGAHSAWTSEVKDVGSGEQEITKLETMKRVETKIHFIEPFESEAESFTTMEENPSGGIIVHWGFSSTMPRPFNAMMLFMNVEESLGEMFDKGLSNLKSKSENETQSKSM